VILYLYEIKFDYVCKQADYTTRVFAIDFADAWRQANQISEQGELARVISIIEINGESE